MKISLIFQSKLVFLNAPEDPDNWGNPYNKAKRMETASDKIEKDPRFNKLTELGRKLSRFSDTLPKENKPYDLKYEVDGETKTRMLSIKKSEAMVIVSIFEKKADNFLIRNDFYFDHTTGKYQKGVTLVKFDEEIRKTNNADPYTLLNILPKIIEPRAGKNLDRKIARR